MRRALAAGTLGPTLLVEDGDGQPALVLKLVTTVTGQDAAMLGAALAETATVGVAHPGVLPVLAAGVDPAGVFLVSPFVDAPTLETRLRGGRQPLAQVLEWLAGPAAALDLAHQRRRHHGAIHPRDILLPRGRGILTGLDISPVLESLGLQAPVRVPFTAPERASGKSWDARADQYSLAMLALDALSGRRLIAGTIPAFDRWTLADTPAEDARLHDVFARSLHPDPAERFPSVAAWLEALAGAAEPASELSRFARHGVIPASAPEARRGAAPEITNDEKPLALFPEEEDAAFPAEDAASVTTEAPVTPVRPPHPGSQVVTQSPTGEWLVASMPEGTTPLADTGPLPIQSVTPLDPLEPIHPLDTGPPRASGEATGDFALHAFDSEQAAVTAGRDDHDGTWSENADLAEESPRRSGAVLAVALLVVALIAFGTWRSLRGPDASSGSPGAVATDIANQAGTVTPGEPSPSDIVDTAPSKGAPAQLAEETLRPSDEDLAPGAPPPATSTTVEVPPAATAPSAATARSTPPAASAQTAVAEAPLSLDRARILIRSSPSGRVRVNGQLRGDTPVVLRNLPFGSYVVIVSRPGYLDAVRGVDVLPSQPVASISVDLERQPAGATAGSAAAPAVSAAPPRPSAGVPSTDAPSGTPGGATAGVGSLYVVSRPVDARLFIDGQPFGTAPAVVPGLRAGRHVVRVEFPGHRPFERTVEVLAGQRVRVDATLVQEPR